MRINSIVRDQNIILIIILITTTLVLHQSVGERFWRWDDPIILKCAIEYTPLEYFFIPENYRCLTGSHVTPWLLFSFDLDFGLWGLFPQGFYWHHLFSLSLVSVASFWLLKLYIRPMLAFIGVMLFIIGSPVWVVAQQLMTRHYVEGLIFAIMALYWYIISLRKNQMVYATIGSFFYILATLAKEIYVPLVGILLFIPETHLKKRLYASLPYFLWSAAYVFYRNYLLGNFVGGYHSDYSFQLLITNFIKAPDLVIGNGYPDIILIVIWLVSLVLLAKSRWLIVSYSLALFLPLLPLFSGGLLDYRFLFLPYWSFCILLVLLINHLLTNYRLTLYLFPILAFFTFKVIDVMFQTQKTVYLYIAEIEEQGKFYWHHTDQEKFLLVTPNLAAIRWYFTGLTWIKANVLHQSMPSLFFNTPSLDTRVNNKTVHPNFWQYDPACFCVEKLSTEKLNTEFFDNQSQNTSQDP